MDARTGEEDSLHLIPCRVCGRTFVSPSLQKHVKICEKSVVKKRKPFDSFKQRVEGTDIAQFHRKTYLKRAEPVAAPEKKKKRNWKEKHLELLSSIRAAKGISPDKEAMPYTKSSSLLADTKRCPACDRQFGPKAYDRHVEWCTEKHAHQRLHHSPANVVLAKERLEARLKYVPPLIRARKLPVKEKYSSSASTRTESTTSLVSQSSVRAKDKKTYLERNKVKVEAEKKNDTKDSSNKPNEVKKNDFMMAISSPSLTSDSTKSSHKKNSMSSSKINSPTVNYELNGITVSSMKCNKTMVTWRDTLSGSKENSKEQLGPINESEQSLSTSAKSENANSSSKNNKKLPIAKVKSKCTVQSKSEPIANRTAMKKPSVINLDFQTTQEPFEEPFEPLITARSDPDFKIEVDIRPNPSVHLNSNQEELKEFSNKLNSESVNRLEKSTSTKIRESPRDLQIKNPTTSDESVKALLKELEKGYQLDINLTDFSLDGITSKFDLDRISPHLDLNATRSRDTSKIELRKTFKNLAITDSCNAEKQSMNSGSKSECELESSEKEIEVADSTSKLELGEDVLPRSFSQNKNEQLVCNDDKGVNFPEMIDRSDGASLQNFHSLNEHLIEPKIENAPSLSAEIQNGDISEDKNSEIQNSPSKSMVKISSNTKEVKKINGLLPKTRTFVISNTNESNNQAENLKPPEINSIKDIDSLQNKKVNNLKTPRSARSSNKESAVSKYNLNRSKTESSLLLQPPLSKSNQSLQLSSRKTNENSGSSNSNLMARPSYELLPNKSSLNMSRSSSENTVLQKSDSKVSLTSWSNETLKDKSSVKIKQNLSSIDVDNIFLKNKSKNEGSTVSKKGSRFGSSRSLKTSTRGTSPSAQKRPHSEYVVDTKQRKEANSSESSCRPVLPKLASVSTIYKAPYVISSSVSSENSVYTPSAEDSSSSREDKQTLVLLYNSKVENVESTDGKMILSLDRFDVVKNCETDDSSGSERKFLSKISVPKNNSEETLMSVLFKSKETFDIDSMNSNKTSSESLPILSSVRNVDCISKKFEGSLSCSENYSVPKKKRRLTDDDDDKETCNVDCIKFKTPKTKFSYKNPNLKRLSADHFLPKIPSDKGDCSCNQTVQHVVLESSDLRLPKIGKEEKSVQVNFYEKISSRYDRVVIRSRYKLKSPGCVSQTATDPYHMAEQQLMELLNCDDFRSITPLPHNTPHDDTIPIETKKEVTPLQTLAITSTHIKPIKDSLVEFEMLESLIEKNLDESKSNFASLNGKLPADDIILIDPALINEDDNLALPENFQLQGDSPTYWDFVMDTPNRKQQMYITPEPPNELKNLYICKTSTPKATVKRITSTTPIKANTKPSVKRSLTVNNPKHRKPLTRSISSVSSEKSVCSEKEKASLKKEPVKATKNAKTKHLKQEETIDKWLQESNEKNSLESSFKPEELDVDDSTYEEFKKYEEMYLKERKQKNSSKKSKAKMIDLTYNILTPGEEQPNANNKLTIDSAYGSLTRSAPDYVAKSLTLPQLDPSLVDNPIIDGYSQSSSPSPTLPKSQLAKFCHECGNRYPVVTAKFCIECGVRRLIL